MSIALNTIDLTGASVGKTGTISLPLQGLPNGQVLVYNESGCGLSYIVRPSGGNGFIPAGQWTPVAVKAMDQGIDIRVIYTLPNPPVSTVLATYYPENEQVPNLALGNSPIGIGGTVQTSSVQTLSNEGGAVSSLVIDLGDVHFNQLWAISNDGHGTLSVDQSSVAHQLLKFNASGNPLQLGQSGDISEVLGNLTVDGTSTLTGNATLSGTLGVTGLTTLTGGELLPNNVALQGNDSGGAAHTMLLPGSGNATILRAMTASGINMQDSGAVNVLQIISTLVTINQALSILDPSTVLNGSTSGTATLYQPLRGNIKLVFVNLVNFRNGNAGDQLLNIPVPFTSTTMVWTSQSGPFHLNHPAGTNALVVVQSTWPSAAGNNGGTFAANTVGSSSYTFCTTGACDQIGFFGSQASAQNGTMLLVGI